jgi:hypothetical protein
VRDQEQTNVPRRLIGRSFGVEALQAIRQEIGLSSPRLRAEIARRVCARLNWQTPGGQPALMSARVALLRLQARGLIELPRPRNSNANGRVRLACALVAAAERLEVSLGTLQPVELQIVRTKEQSRLWNGLIARYHYLGHHNLPGAQIRYLVYSKNQFLLGALGFGAAAWTLSVRDKFISWNAEQRQRFLPWVLNNARFLILPWVVVPNLASHILGCCARQLTQDFEQRYGWRPVLLETFVQEGYRGTCYRAANWKYLGPTQGRGKKGSHAVEGKTPVPLKEVWIYPLVQDFRRVLCADTPLG